MFDFPETNKSSVWYAVIFAFVVLGAIFATTADLVLSVLATLIAIIIIFFFISNSTTLSLSSSALAAMSLVCTMKGPGHPVVAIIFFVAILFLYAAISTSQDAPKSAFSKRKLVGMSIIYFFVIFFPALYAKDLVGMFQ